MSDVTRILGAIEQGDPAAAEALLPLVYDELRKLAAMKLNKEKGHQTIQPTILVHEAYLRLVNPEQPVEWNGRGHFFGAAAEAMRRILIENYRRKQSQKRAHVIENVDVANLADEPDVENHDLVALDEALCKFEREWPEKAKLVKLRYFAGLTIPEAAQVLGISTRSAERTWTYAKVWLLEAMKNPS
jgi:RNA polymerase sigma factor (TIGR02999 family)